MALKIFFIVAIQALYVAGRCLHGSKPYNGSCYYFSHDKEEWTSAMLVCTDFLGGTLVEVNDEGENTFLVDSINDLSTSPYWMGATDMALEGVWQWTRSNTRLAYSNWLPGEPSNYLGQENCMSLASKGQWNDLPCSFAIKFICELPQM